MPSKIKVITPLTEDSERTAPKRANTAKNHSIGFEAKLWLTADKLRNNMDAAEYKSN